MNLLTATRSEFTKFFTTNLWWVLGLILVVYLGLTGAGAGWLFGDAVPAEALGSMQAGPLIYGLASSIGYVFPLIVGVLIVTSEFRHRTLTTTLLATPRRGRVLGSKLTAGFVIGALYGAAAIVAIALPAAALLIAGGRDAALDSPDTWALFGRLLLAYALWTLIGIGIGSLVPNQIVAIVLVLAFTQFVEPILRVAGAMVDWLADVTTYLPGAASDALVGTSFFSMMGTGVSEPLSWSGGAIVLAVYAIVLVALASLTTWRRDVD